MEQEIVETYLLGDNKEWRKLGAYQTVRPDGTCYPMEGRIEKSIMNCGKVIITERVKISNLKYGDECLNVSKEKLVIFRGTTRCKTGHGTGYLGPNDKYGRPSFVQCYTSENMSAVGFWMDSHCARRVIKENNFHIYGCPQCMADSHYEEYCNTVTD